MDKTHIFFVPVAFLEVQTDFPFCFPVWSQGANRSPLVEPQPPECPGAPVSWWSFVFFFWGGKGGVKSEVFRVLKGFS